MGSRSAGIERPCAAVVPGAGARGGLSTDEPLAKMSAGARRLVPVPFHGFTSRIMFGYLYFLEDGILLGSIIWLPNQ
jgi:hypothetical protein